MIPQQTFESYEIFGDTATKTAPDSAKYAAGFQESDVLPAEWMNWAWNKNTKGITDLNTGVTSIEAELGNVVTAGGKEPKVDSNNQVIEAIKYLIAQAKAQAILAAHPVGSLYWTSSTENPSVTFGGGTWTQIKDRFILAAGNTYKQGATAGSATITLKTENIPSHSHTIAHTHSFTPAGTIAAHTHSFTPAGTVSSHTHSFTPVGTVSSHTHSFTPAGTIKMNSHSHSLNNHTHSFTPAGTIAAHTHSFTPKGTISGGSYSFTGNAISGQINRLTSPFMEGSSDYATCTDCFSTTTLTDSHRLTHDGTWVSNAWYRDYTVKFSATPSGSVKVATNPTFTGTAGTTGSTTTKFTGTAGTTGSASGSTAGVTTTGTFTGTKGTTEGTTPTFTGTKGTTESTTPTFTGTAGTTGSTTTKFTGTAGTTGASSASNSGATGGGRNIEIMPPYIVEYCWTRTA